MLGKIFTLVFLIIVGGIKGGGGIYFSISRILEGYNKMRGGVDGGGKKVGLSPKLCKYRPLKQFWKILEVKIRLHKRGSYQAGIGGKHKRRNTKVPLIL